MLFWTDINLHNRKRLSGSPVNHQSIDWWNSYLKYLQGLGDDILVEFIPPYSPELNPTETCWKVIRHNVTNSTYFQSVEKMQMKIEGFLSGHNFNLNPSNYLCR